ncbi:MAG: hypothetical protein ABIK09_20615 [Pseudomonadota bacterium]
MSAIDPKGGRDYIVVSDLHLGEGLGSESERYALVEDFFYDDAFARLLAHTSSLYAETPARLCLVLNGDVFDFLTVASVPDDLELDVSPLEKRFGLDPTAPKSVLKLQAIIAGHPVFFSALAAFVATGHGVEILRGNHDLEIFFPAVQEHLLECLSRIGDVPLEAVRDRVRFHQSFYLDPGRVYIEHGNQYEASNSIRYPLSPVMPTRSPGAEQALDYPLGSLFVRYFYNRVRQANPYAPRVVSIEQYFDFLRHHNPLDLVKEVRAQYPFFISALNPRVMAGSSGPSQGLDEQQNETFELLAESTEPENLHVILSGLKERPLSASNVSLVREMLKPLIRRALWAAGAAVGAIYVWLLLFNLIQAPFLGGGIFVKATLLFLLSMGSILALLWAGSHLTRRLAKRIDKTVERCAKVAEEIASKTGVAAVIMGHTHDVDRRRLDSGGVYINCGTWISVLNRWSNLIPDARRMTFVFVRGDDISLVRWNDDAERIDKVPLFERPTGRARKWANIFRGPGGRTPRPGSRSARPRSAGTS